MVKKAMSDLSPNSLTGKPRLNITRYGKKPLYLVMAGGALLVAILAVSVHLSTQKEETADNRQAAVTVREEESPVILPLEAPVGVAKKPIELEPVDQASPLINVIKPEPPSEEHLARKREWDKIRQYRLATELRALSSSMKVPVPGSSNQAAAVPQPAAHGKNARNHEMPSLQPASIPARQDGYDQSERIDKEGFYTRAERQKWQLNHRRIPGAEFELKTGTVISGMMITGIKSDLPGEISGQASTDVYDTATGRHLLIPRGSRLYGVYDSRVAMGQERVLVAWNRIIFPDGSSITLGAMPGSDMAGYSGYRGSVDNHTWKIFGNAVLMSLISGGAAYAMDSTTGGGSGDTPSVLDEMGGALASQLNQTSVRLLQRNFNIKPSLGIEPGYRFNIVVTKDIVFDGPYEPWR